MARRPPAATRTPRAGRPPRRSAPDSRSVWWDLADRTALAPTSPLSGTVRSRTAIVGSGVAGLSLAVALARRGDDVVVLDREHAASGATGRNAGFLLRDSECLALAGEMHGVRAADALHELGLATRAFVRSFEGARFRVQWTGSVRLASDAGEARHFAATAARRIEGIREEDARSCPEGGDAGPWLAALADDGDGMLDPLGLVGALVAACDGRGVRRFDGTTARRLVPRPSGIDVVTAGGTVRADRVVVATNADAVRLVPGFGRSLRPVRAQALAARVDLVPAWSRPTYATRGGEYWRLLPDGRVLLGGLRRLDRRAENTADRSPTGFHQRALDAFLRRLVGRAARIDVTHRWAGTMGFTRDGLPLVGPVGPAIGHRARVHLLAGWNGHGMGWAPGAADALAARLQAAGPPPPKVFSPGRNLGAPPGDS